MTSIPMTTEYVDVKVKIGEIEYTNEELQIDSIKISNGCYDGSVFGIGNVYIKNASITMNYLDGISKGLNIEIFFQYQGAWISFGQFVVTETPVMSGDKLSVSLESTLAQYANTEIVFAEAKPNYNFDTIIKKIEEITGKVVVFKSELDSIGTEKSEFLSKSANFIKDAKTLMDPASGCKTGVSVKTALAGIAILFGGNVYEDTNNKIVIKQKTYSLNSDRYILPDYLDGNYKYSKEVYAIKTISLLFNKYVLGIYYRKETDPPGDDIWTQNYLDEDKVSNTLLASQSSMTGKTPYNYTVTCDWIGWTSDGFGYNLNEKPGGRASACLRQGDLMYHTCDMTFVGIDFGWNIAPGNLIKVKVPELDNPIDVLCGEISYEWDGGFTTNISCNCNIESNGSYSTEVSTQASAAAAQEGRQTSLELNYANITFSNIEDSTIRGSIFKDGTIDGSKIKDSTITGSLIADSTIKGSNIEEGTITGSKIKAATITGALIVDGTIRGNHIMESSIDGSKIEDSAITESKISNSSITNSKIKDGEIENSKIKDATLTGAKIKDATIGFAKVDSSFIKDLTADKAYIENLKASIADIGYLTADEANIKYATIASLEAVDGKIDNLKTIAITTNNLSAKVAELGYLNADTADIAYAKIDFSNVGTQVVSSSMIIDGAVTNEKVANLSANKITSGTIDASKITVTNLNADNLTVGTINGKLIGNGSVDLDKLSQEVPTKEYLDSVQKGLQGQIDGAIETFTKSEIPTLNNEPSSSWTDTETRKKHIGDVCYVLNPASSADGYCYRFANTGTEASPQYEWVLIKDSDVTKALQDIIDINGEITGIKQFDTGISAWKTDTDNELSSLKTRTTNLETDIGTKVSSSVFNELKQTVDKNSASITSLSDTVSKKADGSTVETLTNTVNEVKQTADSNSLSISSMQTEIGKKADGSTVTELSTRTSNLEQNLDGFKTEVSKTYTTKTEFDKSITEVKTIAEQTADKFSWLVKSGTSSTNFTLTDRVASLLSEQFNIDALTTFKNSAESGTSTVIDGGAIKTNSIKASSIDVDNLFAQDITATGTITGATLKGATVEIDAGKIGPLSIASDDRNLRFDLSDSYYLRIGGQIYGKGINIFDNSGFTQVIYSSSGIWMRDEKDAGWDTVITPSRITIGDFIHGTSTEGFEINVPTTVRNALRVESDSSGSEKSYARLNNHEVQLHAMNSSVVFYLSAYSGSSNKFKLYSTTGNIVDITDTTAMTITPKVTSINGITEQGYDVIGCEVTTSGDFTCKKYRDGRLIVEYKKILTSKLPLSNTDWSGIHYAQAEYGYNYFPVGFTEAPSVTSGIAIADLTCPFCTLTIEQITKSYFVRAIVWTIGNISGYELPVGTVVSATFTGRWK